MIRDPLGFTRCYYDLAGRAHAPTVRELFDAIPDLPRALDTVTVAAHLSGRTTPDRSFFREIRAVPPGHQLERSPQGFTTRPCDVRARLGDLPELMRTSIARSIGSAPGPVAVALSGGLDSALVLALAHEIDPSIPGLVLAPQLEGYSELDAATRTAHRVGAQVHVVQVTADDFTDALPAAIEAMEVPLYNLHPVGKLLLARAARRAGFVTLLSGDGADHVLTRDRSADYLPLVGAAFASVGVELCSPFLDDAVMAHLLAGPIDPNKVELRALGATLPIPSELIREKKVGRLAPPIDLGRVVPRGKLERLAAMLQSELPSFRDDRDAVRWATLALLVDAFEAWP
jgi:asparagine synthase (glutamine-hydrolysing)